MLQRAVQCLTNGLAPDQPLTVEARNLLAGERRLDSQLTNLQPRDRSNGEPRNFLIRLDGRS